MPIYPIGHQLTVLETVDSSNNYAMAQVQAGMAVHGHAYFALEQTAGKGQWGRQWLTEPSSNIMLSIVLETTALAGSDAFSLSMAMGLACHDWFKSKAGEETSLKWPNDLYWRDRKAGGILIENKWAGAEWQFAVVGMGLNINQTKFSGGGKTPVSLRQITGTQVDLMESVSQLCNCLDQRWKQLLAGGKKEIHQDYEQNLYGRDKKIKLRKNNMVFETTIKGVLPSGELLTSDSIERQFRVGEIEWL